ncbi:unnamed protein product [Prunus armeniaca]
MRCEERMQLLLYGVSYFINDIINIWVKARRDIPFMSTKKLSNSMWFDFGYLLANQRKKDGTPISLATSFDFSGEPLVTFVVLGCVLLPLGWLSFWSTHMDFAPVQCLELEK